jgi:hypothetical protein
LGKTGEPEDIFSSVQDALREILVQLGTIEAGERLAF